MKAVLSYLSRGLCIFILLKLWMGLQNLMFPKPVFSNQRTEYSLDEIYDIQTETFTLIDRENASFIMRPKVGCVKGERYVVMVLSAPKNTLKRDVLR